MTIEVTYNVTDIYISSEVSPIYIDVNYQTSGGGAAVWGGITGTLSNQSDLQTALNGKFDDPTGTTLQYIDGTGGLQTFPLTLPVLQEVRNQTGATLAAGTVVYISGATGNKPTVSKAIATGDNTSAQTLGMIQNAIANNSTGYVVVIGTCSGLDTSAYTEGQQLYLSYTTAGAVTTTKPYAPNHLVYVGIVTRSHPTLGTIEVRVQNGYEMDELHNVDAYNPTNNDGLFYNTTTSLWEHKSIGTVLGYNPEQPLTFSSPLSRLVNAVSIPAATSSVNGYISSTDWSTFNGKENVLTFSSPLSRSTNTISIPQATSSVSGFLSSTDWSTFNSKQGALTLTTTGTSGAATLVGNTLNIPQYSGGGGMAIGGSITSATAGSILFAGTSGVLAQNNANFFWDNTNTRLGIGTSAPVSRFEVVAGSDANGIKLRGRSADNISNFFFSSNDGVSQYGYLQHRSNEMRIVNNVGDLVFYTGPSVGFTEPVGRWFSTGNLVIQTSGTLSDAGFKVDVNGTARIQGNFTTNLTLGSIPFIGTSGVLAQDNTNLFWDDANDRLGIRTSSPNAALHVSGSTTASGAIARGANYTPTLVAAANNDVLVGLDVSPTFTNGAFTGVSNLGIRSSSPILIYGTNPGVTLNSTSLATNYVQGFTFSVNGSAKFSFGYAESGSSPRFFIYNVATDKDAIKIYNATANVVIGNASSSNTDAGFRLDVAGTCRVQSALTVGTNALYVNTTNLRIGNRTSSPGAGLDLWNNGITENAQLRISDSRVSIPDYTATGFDPVLTTNTLGFFAPFSSSTGGLQFGGFTSNTNTGTPLAFIGYQGGTSPTSAAIRFIGYKHNGTTNRTALTGNEIIAGFSSGFAADVFQVKANGRINMSSLPTSSAGLSAGDLWNNLGIINIV